MDKIPVLIVDDSAVIRLRIKQILEEDPEIMVVGIARTGNEAVQKVVSLRPRVVTMDVQMPGMDGLAALEIIMRDYPLPVVMLSALTARGTVQTLKTLELGAVDFIQKPSGADSKNLAIFARDLREKIKMAAGITLRTPGFSPVPPSLIKEEQSQSQIEVVAIGTSTGGPAALKKVIPFLPADFPAAVLVVQHIPRGYTGPMAERLDKISALRVIEAEHKMVVEPGKVYIAPAGKVFTLSKVGKKKEILLDACTTSSPFTPSVNDMMVCTAAAYGSSILGVLLTGMGNDGVQGLAAIKRAGGKTMVEAESSCVVFGMPKSAIEEGVADEVADLSMISQAMVKKVMPQG